MLVCGVVGTLESSPYRMSLRRLGDVILHQTTHEGGFVCEWQNVYCKRISIPRTPYRENAENDAKNHCLFVYAKKNNYTIFFILFLWCAQSHTSVHPATGDRKASNECYINFDEVTGQYIVCLSTASLGESISRAHRGWLEVSDRTLKNQ